VAQLDHSTDSDRLLTRLSEDGLNLEGAEDLAGWVRETTATASRFKRTGLGCVLASMARQNPTAGLCAIVLLRPQLELMCRRLVRCGVDPEEAEAEALAAAWEVFAHFPGPSDPVAITPAFVVNAIWVRCRRSSGVRRMAALELTWAPDSLDVSAPECDPLERWPGLLASAVAAGVLTPRQVVVIARTRMEGHSLTDVARAVGRPYGATKKERQRAEAALRSFALRYSSEGSR
jgi:DNA-directed RNA polymerase specialized sigma24 family protein